MKQGRRVEFGAEPPGRRHVSDSRLTSDTIDRKRAILRSHEHEPRILDDLDRWALLLAACGSNSTHLSAFRVRALPTGQSRVSEHLRQRCRNTTTNAQIRIDDQTGAETELHVGDIVTVNGTVNTDAKRAPDPSDVQRRCAGAVATIDSAGGTFIVLGPTIRVTGLTLLMTTSTGEHRGLAMGTLVEVSGSRTRLVR